MLLFHSVPKQVSDFALHQVDSILKQAAIDAREIVPCIAELTFVFVRSMDAVFKPSAVTQSIWWSIRMCHKALETSWCSWEIQPFFLTEALQTDSHSFSSSSGKLFELRAAKADPALHDIFGKLVTS